MAAVRKRARAHIATSPSVASSHLARACCARVLMCCAPRPRAHGAGAYQLRVADAQAPDATDGERPIARRLGRSEARMGEGSLARAQARTCFIRAGSSTFKRIQKCATSGGQNKFSSVRVKIPCRGGVRRGEIMAPRPSGGAKIWCHHRPLSRKRTVVVGKSNQSLLLSLPPTHYPNSSQSQKILPVLDVLNLLHLEALAWA